MGVAGEFPEGDMKTLEDYLQASGTSIDEKDAKGISCLGYAIGANRTHVVKKLLESKVPNANKFGERILMCLHRDKSD